MKKIQGVIALLVGLMVVFSGCSSKKTDKVEGSTLTECTQSTSSSSIQEEDSQESTTQDSSQDGSDVHTTDGSIGASPSQKPSSPAKSADAATKGTNDNKTAAKAPGTTSGTAKKPSGTSSRSNSSGAGLMGEVTAVQDGSVTLKLIEMPQIQRGQGSGGHVRPSPGAGAPAGSHPQGQGHGQITPKYTGETKTVKIPAGVPVTTVTRGQSGMETKNIEVKDIKAGDMLQVWFSDAGKTVVSKVSVSNFRKK